MTDTIKSYAGKTRYIISSPLQCTHINILLSVSSSKFKLCFHYQGYFIWLSLSWHLLIQKTGTCLVICVNEVSGTKATVLTFHSRETLAVSIYPNLTNNAIIKIKNNTKENLNSICDPETAKTMDIPVWWFSWLFAFGCPLPLWFWTAGSPTRLASHDWLQLQVLTVWSAEPGPGRGAAEDETCSSKVFQSMLPCTLTESLSYLCDMTVILSAEYMICFSVKEKWNKCMYYTFLQTQVHESVLRLWWEQRSLVAELQDGHTGRVWCLLVFLSVCCAAVWP